MSENCNNDILESAELEFIDDIPDNNKDTFDDNDIDYFTNIIKKCFVTLYKLIKEIITFICKIFYGSFVFARNKINENNKILKDQIESQHLSKSNNNTIFNKNLLANKSHYVQNIQDNSEINDILGIDSVPIKSNRNNLDDKNIITCRNINNTKNKIYDKPQKIKKKNFNMKDICDNEFGNDDNNSKSKHRGQDTDVMCELFKM